MPKVLIPLSFSDVDFGCIEYGFITRDWTKDPDDEDLRYERHVRARVQAERHSNAEAATKTWRVYDGILREL